MGGQCLLYPNSTWTWTRRAGYEVTSAGDWRFSALFAILPDGRTIEEHYQCDVKGFNPGGRNWREYKGKPCNVPRDLLWAKYVALWKIWIENNPGLVKELYHLGSQHGKVLRDRFANSEINQARVFADHFNEMEFYGELSTHQNVEDRN